MDGAFRLLFVEDQDAGRPLARWELKRDGRELSRHCATSESALRGALVDFSPNIVLCDYAIPGSAARAVLEQIRVLCPSTPVLFISGTIGADIVIESVGFNGAAYVFKTSLGRPGTAVRRTIRDAREKDFEARLHHLAHYDTLTGLPNLVHVSDLVRREIYRACRSSGVVAVAAVNLDAFRLVDEGFGRAVGDDLLKSVGALVKAEVCEGDAVARVGPDEFLVILPELADPVDATEVVQRILDSIAVPRSIAGHDVQITASAGVAVYPNDGGDFETLLCKASAAMHEVKARSRGRLQFHSGDVEQHARRRLDLEAGLRNAIERHDLSLHYQPQYETLSGHACGVEALARWVRSDGESVPPSIFIPLAEQAGLIAPLGSWVLQEACSTVAGWDGPNGHPPTLCVNVSSHQICRDFSGVIAHVIELTGFPARRLELELTESALIADAQLALECMGQWKRLGVRIALDDFGTGYSSLSYLSKLPVDRLKLDKSLIDSMTTEPKDAAIVRALISLGQELGFAVIAEGVETEEQFEMLQDLDCRQVQGNLLATSTSAAEARALLATRWGSRPTITPSTPCLAPGSFRTN
jgi:diguanylate cyclase (GGDEF)-like protein